jgi:predicted  nucleic acid-binding Zn-ribbon protein
MNELDELTIAVRKRARDLDSLSGEARAVAQRGKDLQDEIGGLTTAISELERVAGLFNSLGEERQIKAQQNIEGIVTRGLQMIFDESLSFHILQSVKNKTAVVDFVVRTTLPDNSIVETGVLDARGGGLAATVGFLLRQHPDLG